MVWSHHNRGPPSLWTQAFFLLRPEPWERFALLQMGGDGGGLMFWTFSKMAQTQGRVLGFVLVPHSLVSPGIWFEETQKGTWNSQ